MLTPLERCSKISTALGLVLIIEHVKAIAGGFDFFEPKRGLLLFRGGFEALDLVHEAVVFLLDLPASPDPFEAAPPLQGLERQALLRRPRVDFLQLRKQLLVLVRDHEVSFCLAHPLSKETSF